MKRLFALLFVGVFLVGCTSQGNSGLDNSFPSKTSSGYSISDQDICKNMKLVGGHAILSLEFMDEQGLTCEGTCSHHHSCDPGKNVGEKPDWEYCKTWLSKKPITKQVLNADGVIERVETYVIVSSVFDENKQPVSCTITH